MAQSILQSSSVGVMVFTTNTCNLVLNGVAAGSDIVVQVGGQQFSVTPDFTVNDGTAYTEESKIVANTVIIAAQYRLRNVGSGTHTIVVTCASISADSYCNAVASEVDGDADVAKDQTVTNSGSSTTMSTGNSSTLAQANEIVFVTAIPENDATGATNPPTTGYSSIAALLADANPYLFGYKVVADTAAVSAAWGTMNTSRQWAVALNTFKGVAAASTDVPVLSSNPQLSRRRRYF